MKFIYLLTNLLINKMIILFRIIREFIVVKEKRNLGIFIFIFKVNYKNNSLILFLFYFLRKKSHFRVENYNLTRHDHASKKLVYLKIKYEIYTLNKHFKAPLYLVQILLASNRIEDKEREREQKYDLLF